MFTNNFKPGNLIAAMLVTAALGFAVNEVHQFVTRDLREPIRLARKKLAVKLSNMIYPDQTWE